MKILVCISNVPDTTTKITFNSEQTEFNTSGVQFVINPYDEIALTRAIEITEKDGGTVTVLHVGEASADPTIRKALAMGAHDAIRVNAAPRDAWFVANQISNVANGAGYDLILMGRESIDHNGSQMAALVGELMNIPSISICKSLTLEGNKATVDREIEGGKEVAIVETPFIASASEGMAEPRIPNMRGIMSARTKPLNVVEAVAVDTLSEIISYDTPKGRGQVTLVEADNTDKLVELLHTEAKVI